MGMNKLFLNIFVISFLSISVGIAHAYTDSAGSISDADPRTYGAGSPMNIPEVVPTAPVGNSQADRTGEAGGTGSPADSGTTFQGACDEGQVYVGGVGGRCVSGGSSGSAGSSGRSSGGGSSSGQPPVASEGGGVAPPADPVCVQQYQSIFKGCQNSVNLAGATCDSENNKGLSKATNTLANIASAAGSLVAGSGVNGACSKAALAIQGANVAVAAFRTSCSGSISKCISSCQSAIDFIRDNGACFGASYQQYADEAQGAGRTCESYKPKVDQANQAISNFATTYADSQNCDLASTAEMKTFCEENPTYPACAAQVAANCSDPVMASTNKVCICAANPYALECTNGQSAASANSKATGGSADFSSRLKSNDASSSYSGADLNGLPGI